MNAHDFLVALIAESIMPMAAAGRTDLAAAPRSMLVATLQLAIVLPTGLFLLVVTQPVLGGIYAPVLFGMLLLGLVVAFWRGATDLHGHVRAGAEAIVEIVLQQAHNGGTVEGAAAASAEAAESARRQVLEILPGLGEPTPVQLRHDSPAVGKSLGEINLRSVTGAGVLVIVRGEGGAIVPSAREVLRLGDILAVAGTQEALTIAKALLLSPSTPKDA